MGIIVLDVEGVCFCIVYFNIIQVEKWGDGGVDFVCDCYMVLINWLGLEDVIYVLWFEGVLFIYMLEDGQIFLCLGVVLNDGFVLIVGINCWVCVGDEIVYYNVLLVVCFEQGLLYVDVLYDKVLLVFFGEIILLVWLILVIGFDEFVCL